MLNISEKLVGIQKLQQSYLDNKEGLRRILASCVCRTVEIARNVKNK